MREPANKWNERYRLSGESAGPDEAALVLRQNAHLLPGSGLALDLACGLGGNALFLAQQGLEVVAWDLSPVAIEKLQQTATQFDLPIQAQVRDVVHQPPAPQSFEVIAVSHYLERRLVPLLVEALTPGGLVYYQTFTREKVSDQGPENMDYRLSRNELLALFAPLSVLVYREEGRVGDIRQGFRDQAMLVARKPLD